MAVDRAKVRTMLSIVSLSLIWGFNAEYVIKDNVSTIQPVRLEEAAERKNVLLKVHKMGKVSDSTVEKVRVILKDSLSPAAYQFLCDTGGVILLGKTTASDYLKSYYGVDKITVGSKIPNMSGTKIIIPEDYVEQILPQIASELQNYHNTLIARA